MQFDEAGGLVAFEPRVIAAVFEVPGLCRAMSFIPEPVAFERGLVLVRVGGSECVPVGLTVGGRRGCF